MRTYSLTGTPPDVGDGGLRHKNCLEPDHVALDGAGFSLDRRNLTTSLTGRLGTLLPVARRGNKEFDRSTDGASLEGAWPFTIFKS
jgi:hypothetical protein